MINIPPKSTIFVLATYITAILVLSGGRPAICQAPVKEESLKKLKQLTEEINAGLNSSNHEIEIGNFEQASLLTEKNLGKIEQLADIFMPLPERIKGLISREESILADTRQAGTSKTQNQTINQEAKQALTHRQIKNRDDTLKPIRLLEHQMQNQPKGNENGGNPNEKRKLLNEINVLLKSAYSSQDQVVSFLNQSKFAAAIPEEERSIQELKKALEKLTRKQRNQQQSQDQQNQQQSKQPQQNQANRDQKQQNQQNQPQ